MAQMVKNLPLTLILTPFHKCSHMCSHMCNAGDQGLIPGWGRSPGGGHGNPFHYSCLENSMNRGTWQATVHRVSKSLIRLSDQTHTNCCEIQYVNNIGKVKRKFREEKKIINNVRKMNRCLNVYQQYCTLKDIEIRPSKFWRKSIF